MRWSFATSGGPLRYGWLLYWPSCRVSPSISSARRSYRRVLSWLRWPKPVITSLDLCISIADPVQVYPPLQFTTIVVGSNRRDMHGDLLHLFLFMCSLFHYYCNINTMYVLIEWYCRDIESLNH